MNSLPCSMSEAGCDRTEINNPNDENNQNREREKEDQNQRNVYSPPSTLLVWMSYSIRLHQN